MQTRQQFRKIPTDQSLAWKGNKTSGLTKQTNGKGLNPVFTWNIFAGLEREGRCFLYGFTTEEKVQLACFDLLNPCLSPERIKMGIMEISMVNVCGGVK